MQLKNYILALVFFLMVITIKGQFIWQIALGTSNTDYSIDMITTQDSNYLVVGASGGLGLYLAKIDTGGNILWEKWHNNAGGIVNTICETVDSGFVAGNRMYNGFGYEGFLVKFNANGDTLFTLRDSVNLGSEVYKVWLAPDGNLLASIDYHGVGALVKMDNNFNVLARIDNITKAIKGVEIINNTIYMLLNDSINNLLMIDDNLAQIDTVTLPVLFPLHLLANYNADEVVIYGRDSSFWQNPHKMVYVDLLGNVTQVCDSVTVPDVFNGHIIDDFEPIDNQGHLLFVSQYYQQQWGSDVKLYWTDKCGQVIKDTILYRWSLNTSLNERAKKLIVDNEGNYLVTGYAQEGPLGGDDIFVFKYKKVVMSVEEENPEEKEGDFPTPILYPNPFTDGFVVKGISANTKITVFDMSGRMVEQQVSTGTGFIFTTTHWAKGLYVIQLRSITNTTNLKVVKQ
ncbi:MAG: T9SS type A sorting domain-containing protein [Flavobacteriales bacterium]|nr:T9SS type A sorting domain-containing protein [Flavobacteriales bacterium]